MVGAHEFRERFGYWMERAAAGDEILITRHGKRFARLTAADSTVHQSELIPA
jgi:prevent-host-death family protein